MTNDERRAVGACDDCGAENVAIWQTEYNWQCAGCKADDEIAALRTENATLRAEVARLREALTHYQAQPRYYDDTWCDPGQNDPYYACLARMDELLAAALTATPAGEGR